MPIENILIIDDEPLMLHYLREFLERKGYNVESADTGKKGLVALKESSFDVVITDMKLPDISGIEVIRKVKEHAPHTLVIVMTAYGTIENAVEAMRLQAFHYILKPFTPDMLEIALQKAKEHLLLTAENKMLREEMFKTRQTKAIISESAVMQRILQDVVKIAKSDASVLIHGESGTGKELVANAIHAHSPRAKNPYIRVNCAAIPDTLLESEFFGHEKGSFTGALTKRLGRFELADKGTLFLDEVTEIPLSLQPKLLRAIQEREFERVGGTKPLTVDIRLLSSSNRDLKAAIHDKIFREDLFYRLNVIPLYLPPLRERREDILPLAHYFISRFSPHKKHLTPTAEKRLLDYPWPGNIRELANVMERTLVLDKGTPTLTADDLYLD